MQEIDQLSAQNALRKSSRIRKPTISNDYVYLQKAEFDLGDIDDLVTYNQAIQSPQVVL